MDKQKLIIENMDLAKNLAWKVHQKVFQMHLLEDLEQSAFLGLVQAAKQFDPNKNHDFRRFAYFRIRGEVYDYIRSQSFLPRTFLDKLKNSEPSMAAFAIQRHPNHDIFESSPMTPEKITSAKNDLKEVTKRFPDQMKACFLKYYLEGKSLKQISAEENISPARACQLKQHVEKFLRRLAAKGKLEI